MKRYACLVLAVAMVFTLATSQAFAATATASATVSATVPAVTSVSLIRDTGSATRGTATSIVFDKLDSQDPVGGSGNPAFMYAPYRTAEAGKNWHLANVAANGATMTLAMSVTGTVGTTPLSSILYVFSGGFFETGATAPITNTPSTDWEFAQGWQRQLNQPFFGTVPFNYRLNVGTIRSGTYTGSITITLTTA